MAGRKRRAQEETDEGVLDEIPGVDFLTWEEGRALFDREARKALGISGDEFLRRWDAGEFRPIPDTPEGWKIGSLVMMIPFARPTTFGVRGETVQEVSWDERGSEMAMRKRHAQEETDDSALDEIPGVDMLSPEESWAFFDREARMALGISGEEFLRRWDAGEFRPVPDTPEGWKYGHLVMMMPFVRPTKS